MEQANNQLLYEIYLSDVCKNNPYEVYKVLDVFGSAEEFYKSSRFNLKTLINFGFEKFINLNKNLDIPNIIIENCSREKIDIVSIDDDKYPVRLKNISCPPRLLYVKGNLPNIDNMLSITVVGCRDPSSYGVKSALQISYDLASCGVLIVSGMALGIDKLAHIGALDANKPTVAVLPRGVDEAYPKQHRSLYEFIQTVGAVISEYPPKTPVLPHVFEIRNRIMSGLSMGVLVIEAKNKSGTRHTVKHALENNRDVFALLGSVTSKKSDYPNKLICDGALPVRNAEDILGSYIGTCANMLEDNLLKSKKNYFELNFMEEKIEEKKSIKKTSINAVNKPDMVINKILEELSEEEKIIFEYLRLNGKSHIDKIVTDCKISVSSVNSSIMLLQMKKLVLQSAGQMYELN